MRHGLWFVAAAVMFLAGCSNSRGPVLPQAFAVKGKVQLASGQPVRTGRLTFHAQENLGGIEPFADIQKDGSFAVTTYKLNDGAIPGSYVVTVSPVSYTTGNLQVSKDFPVPKRYQDKETSTWKVEIKAESNELVLRVP